MSAERRRLRAKKILVASLGVATIGYGLIGCEKQYPVGNLMPPRDFRDLPDATTQPADASSTTTDPPDQGAPPDAAGELDPGAIVTSGNLMAPRPRPDAATAKPKK